MTIVQKLKGVTFNNASLPILTIDDFISDGLLAWYRFGAGTDDLSGNGNDLVAVGSPTVSNGYALLNNANYYDTGIALPSQFTVIAVFMVEGAPTNNQFIMGDYYVGTPNKGMLFFSRAGNASAVNMHTSDYSDGLYSGGSGPSVNGSFVWQSMSVDAAKNAKWRIPREAYTNDKTFAGTVSPGVGTFKIGTVNAAETSTINTRRVVECMIYNRGLTDVELATQYQKSKTYAQTLGISNI